MTYQQNDIVVHTSDTGAIGIVRGDHVEWWSLRDDKCVYPTPGWNWKQLIQYLKLAPENRVYLPNFSARLHKLGICNKIIYKETDTPLIRKIKKLDYEWEIKMKAKGTFYLTSRAQDVDQKTTSQSIQMDTATVSDVNTILSGFRNRPWVLDELFQANQEHPSPLIQWRNENFDF